MVWTFPFLSEQQQSQGKRELHDQLLNTQFIFKEFASKFSGSPKKIIYKENKLKLYHFKSRTKKVCMIPVLIVFALVNRPDILDLTDNCSFIKNLLDLGLDIYLIDWGYPNADDKQISLTTYITGYLKRCVEQVLVNSKQKQLNLLGICQGGVFSLCYSSIYPKQIKNLITIATAVDFHTSDNIISQLVQKLDVDSMVNTLGNIPGLLQIQFFASLKPLYLLSKKYLDLITNDPDAAVIKRFMSMEKWIYDMPDLAGEAFREFVKYFYQHNALIKQKIKLGRRQVILKKLTMPILNIIAESDYLIPPSASKALKKYVGTKDYSEVILPGGHIGLYVSHKTQTLLPTKILEWINQRI